MPSASKFSPLPIRVLVLDPPDFRTEAIAKSIDHFPDITVVQANCTAAEAAAQARRRQVDVIVVPTSMVRVVRRCKSLLSENHIQGLVMISDEGEIRFWHAGRFHEASLDDLACAIRASCGRDSTRKPRFTNTQTLQD